MTCAGAMATFRLLDDIVGWDADPSETANLAGFDDPGGLTLAPTDPGAVAESSVTPYLPPRWLAPGCGPQSGYLVTPATQSCGEPILWSRLLRLGPCDSSWVPVYAASSVPVAAHAACDPLPEADLVALAVVGNRLALADRANAGIVLLADHGDRVVARLPCDEVVAMTFLGTHNLLVARAGEPRLLRFDAAGHPLPSIDAALPVPAAQITRIAAGLDGVIWLATPGASPGLVHLWSARPRDAAFVASTLAELAASLHQSSLLAADADGFCLSRGCPQGDAPACCYSRYGRALAAGALQQPAPLQWQRGGRMQTLAIDSGMPRCVWHRVNLDADLPPGTSVTVAVATTERPRVPHDSDWQSAPAGACEWLVRQPPGRYMFLRLTLASSTGTVTPRVHRLRLDFPRVTSLDLLPPVYRQEPAAEDFTERFLALFDASIADLDAAIERAPALLDVGGVPDEVLPWLAAFLGVGFDPAWQPARRRAILEAIPALYRKRGTRAGIKLAFQLVFDGDPAIDEPALQRPWASLGQRSVLGGLRLFGRNRARARIGSATLGATIIKSYGDPATDPHDALGWRFTLRMPSSQPADALLQQRLQQLLDSQKPAHTIGVVRTHAVAGFLLRGELAVGIDTAFLPLPAPVLGRAGNVRLNRTTVLHRAHSVTPGNDANSFVVGVQPLTG